ncbi:MAG: glycosyltransferase [Bacteroidales bacterium]|nr:glycosyltransferase [Bacteroidales bacterium]
MKILFVVNNYFALGNGLSASARRTVQYLREAGEEVRVLSGPNPDPHGSHPDYELKHLSFGILEPILKSQGYNFAKTDRRIITEAIRWCDVVHLEEPFVIQMVASRIAKKLRKPCTGTYHLHPENIFYTLGMGWWRGINASLLLIWRDFVFNYCSDLQCPSQNVLERLKRYGFRSHLHLISNGIIPDAPLRPREAPETENKPYIVACIGRLSGEKDQFTLLRSMNYCHNADRIKLIFAGRGPKRKALQRKVRQMVNKGILKNEPSFEFMDRDGLRNLASRADLYIHCAIVEVEGLSALEALQQAVVPVIAKGRLSATPQFALDERSLFEARNPKDLAARIDLWLDNDEERHRMAWMYAESTKNYDIQLSIAALQQMFRQAEAL